MNITKQLKFYKNDYTNSEVIIADYFINGGEAKSSKELSNILSVSAPTISRFVKKIGFSSYEIFINAYEREKIVYNNKDVVDEIYEGHLEMLIQNYKLLNDDSINNLIQRFRNNKIIIAAIENTSLPCIDFAKRVSRFGIDIRVVKTQEEIVIESTLLEEGDVFIAVSVSGINKTFEKIIKLLKQRGVFTYGISTSTKNLTSICDDKSIIYLEESSVLSHNFSYLFPLVLLFDNMYVRFENKTSDDQKSTRSKILNEILDQN